MLNADGSAVTGGDTYGYAESGKSSAKVVRSGSKKKLLLLFLPLICLVPLIICGIVAIALIPVYLGGGDGVKVKAPYRSRRLVVLCLLVEWLRLTMGQS